MFPGEETWTARKKKGHSSLWPKGHDQHQQEEAPRERLLLTVSKELPKLKLCTSAMCIVIWEVVAEGQ